MSFEIWLKIHGYGNCDFTCAIDYLKNPDSNIPIEMLPVKDYILSQINECNLTPREKRKQIAINHYQSIRQRASKLKKSEVVKIVAGKMNVKPDCIYAYLREEGIAWLSS